VTDLEWQGEGPDFRIQAAGRPWRLKLDEPQPCLSWSDGRSMARLLGLLHVASPTRRDDRAFEPSSLVSCEHHRGRVQATYAPRTWHGLTIRASWEPTPDRDGFDLEVQLGITSTGVLRRVEAVIGSHWSGRTGDPPPTIAYRVEPRDVHAAALSYDGRELPSVLHSLTTLPIPAILPRTLSPKIYREHGSQPGRCYIEMVQPNDCARRIIGESNAGDSKSPGVFTIRYGLFGHDLEKGVVLRGRIRGVWVESHSPEQEARQRYEAFVGEPPALGR
jgi:hypothetical protein